MEGSKVRIFSDPGSQFRHKYELFHEWTRRAPPTCPDCHLGALAAGKFTMPICPSSPSRFELLIPLQPLGQCGTPCMFGSKKSRTSPLGICGVLITSRSIASAAPSCGTIGRSTPPSALRLEATSRHVRRHSDSTSDSKLWRSCPTKQQMAVGRHSSRVAKEGLQPRCEG